ncbi:MAG: N-acetylmuramoyl-L-alanine amidase [Pseudomonadota bacterium]|uniref:N-acetylmuramoyl-L-alanine amidase n=1 Tax=Roseovarius TaxID=74030 RepID=UPI0022A8D13B|nr:N-acetylmuramoyl-L-alanine amidase [Roseovarius sp. EGI FJ00037]MCZ0813962.1 N-acetylmuramoyl-L-alanine amidase [Roseovarius sp. EGI FJ00037]
MIRIVLAGFLGLWAVLAAAQERDFSGLARLDAQASGIEASGDGVVIALGLSQGVPYRIFTLDAPERLVLDFKEVDWSGIDGRALMQDAAVKDVRVGGFRPGWSRMVVDLGAPMAVARAGMEIDDQSGAARLEVGLRPVSREDFAADAGAPALPGWEAPGRGLKAEKRPRQRGEVPLVVVLDPGHGGIDPGAEVDGLAEKDMMLIFALELKEVLVRAGGFDVVLTREDDSFVSLERRVAIAHRMRADLFLSLHADALHEGRAHGATVYTLSESASDEASAALAERHNRADILAGIDLSGKDDVVADVLMDLARMETQPRAERLAGEIRAAIGAKGLPLHSRPLRHAGFSVLKSPDIPSALVELGFMSSPRDLANLADPGWRADMAQALRDGLEAWRDSDAAAADLVRQ